MSPPTATHTSSNGLDAPQRARRGAFVRLLVFASALLFFAMVALLFSRWIIAREPSSVAVVNAGTELGGATVIVEDFDGETSFQSTIDPALGVARFFLEPGRYNMRIIHGPEKDLLYEAEFYMLANRAVKFQLAGKLLPATQPAN